MPKFLPARIRIEIARIGNPVHEILFLAAQEQVSETEGCLLETLLPFTFIQQGR